MRRAEFDRILISMMEAHPGVSDLIFSVGRPFQVESYGELKQVDMHPDVQRLTATQTEKIALNIIGEDRRLIKELIMMGSCDCSYSLSDRFRFTVPVQGLQTIAEAGTVFADDGGRAVKTPYADCVLIMPTRAPLFSSRKRR